MKKCFIPFIVMIFLIVCTAVNAAEYKSHNCDISFDSVTSYLAQNALPGVSHFSEVESPKSHPLYQKYRLTETGAKAFIIAGSVCSGLGSVFLAVGITMGFIPYENFPGWMKTYDHYVYGDSDLWRIDYPYMTAYGSIGITMVLSGALMFLFCMPLLIYGALALYDYSKYAKQNAVTFSGNGLTIKLDNPGKRRI